MPYILTLLLIVIATEAITEILVKSELFEPLRKYLFSRSVDSKVFKFFHDLLDCGYCTSVWIAFFLFIFFMFIVSRLGLNFLKGLIPTVSFDDGNKNSCPDDLLEIRINIIRKNINL